MSKSASFICCVWERRKKTVKMSAGKRRNSEMQFHSWSLGGWKVHSHQADFATRHWRSWRTVWVILAVSMAQLSRQLSVVSSQTNRCIRVIVVVVVVIVVVGARAGARAGAVVIRTHAQGTSLHRDEWLNDTRKRHTGDRVNWKKREKEQKINASNGELRQ